MPGYGDVMSAVKTQTSVRPLTATIWTSIAIALALVGAGSVGGQQPFVVEAPPNASYPDYKQGSSIASRLRRAPAKMFTFDRASLRDVLRYLADDAGQPFHSARKRLPGERSATFLR